MGRDNTVYVGVYLEIPPKKINKVKTHYVSENGTQMTSKFDPSTGKENKQVDEPYVHLDRPWIGFYDYDTITADELLELDEDEFLIPEYSGCKEKHATFLINRTKSKYVFKNEDNVFNLDLLNQDLLNQDFHGLIDSFKEEYSKYLDAIKKEYGEVYVKFGVVYYTD